MNKSLGFSYFLFLFIIGFGIISIYSCEDEMDNTVAPGEDMEEEDCFYVYEEGLDFIYGAWVSIAVIDYVFGDTTYYDVEESRGGFNFDRAHYSDSYELKSDNTFNLFYARQGRKCKDISWGGFEYANDTLSFIGFRDLPPIHVRVIDLVEDTLIVEDVLNSHPSKITMLRIN